jgi:hypothetical protein
LLHAVKNRSFRFRLREKKVLELLGGDLSPSSFLLLFVPELKWSDSSWKLFFWVGLFSFPPKKGSTIAALEITFYNDPMFTVGKKREKGEKKGAKKETI